ncbi:PQQ-binding-like beta-propeller repeat protein [Pseudactinotalea sp.]|uniref:outer membrane protein assembly factor BamB family protein n=1 Tax=Pseudactinotalea sp. TaxID=1926260 RepID=UPI003B3A436C
MSTPDDARFRPGDPTPGDDAGSEYEGTPTSGYMAPTPYGALDESPEPQPQQPQPPQWGSPGQATPAQQPTSPYLNHPTGSSRYPAQPHAPAGAPNSARRGCAIAVLIGGVVMVVIAMIISLVVGRISSGSDDGTGTAPTTTWTDPDAIDETWVVSVEDLTQAGQDSAISRNPDGAFTGTRVIAGDESWVIAWEDDDYVRQGIAALDPVDGTVLWERPLPQVACADREVDGALLCLALDSDTWVFHRIDAVTGEDLDTTDTALDDVQTVHSNGDVLIAVGPANPAPHATVTGLTPDGSEVWSFDIADIENADLMFDHFYDSDGDPVLERPRWRDLGGGLVMLWATPGVAIIDPATGETFVHECRSATPAQDHYYCVVKEKLERYELDGTRTWTAAGLRPATPEEDSDTQLVALSEPTTNQFEVIPIDPETGVVTGAATYRFSQQPGVWTGIVLPPSVYVEPDATFLVGDLEVVALDPETGEMIWSVPLDEGYLGDMVQIGDVAVVNTGDAIGIDMASGEVIWERNTRGDVVRIGDVAVSLGYDEIALLELP